MEKVDDMRKDDDMKNHMEKDDESGMEGGERARANPGGHEDEGP